MNGDGGPGVVCLCVPVGLGRWTVLLSYYLEFGNESPSRSLTRLCDRSFGLDHTDIASIRRFVCH